MKILGTSKHMIHEHEEAGELGLILILITGVLAAVQVFFAKKIAGKEKIFTLLTAVMLLVCSGSMAYVGSLGGKVRRPELRGEVPAKLLATEADLAQTEVECTHDKKDGEAHEAGGTHEAGEAHEHDEAHEHTDAK